MSQFHWILQDDVKDLLLSMFDSQTFNEVISQVVKCDNRSHPTALTTISSLHSGAKDMQIDAVRYKPLTA
jgi:hypothetical protein